VAAPDFAHLEQLLQQAAEEGVESLRGAIEGALRLPPRPVEEVAEEDEEWDGEESEWESEESEWESEEENLEDLLEGRELSRKRRKDIEELAELLRRCEVSQVEAQKGLRFALVATEGELDELFEWCYHHLEDYDGDDDEPPDSGD
jgi:myosin heavy subunit